MAIDYSVVLDKNERQRMLDDGYLPEVIDWHAKERFEKLQDEFRWKNTILKSFFEAAPYYEFVEDVFTGADRLMVVTADDTYQEMDADELMEYQATRDNVYVAPATFINGCYKKDTCQNVHALVVDIDRVQPETLQVVLGNKNVGNKIPMPTYIVNSGRGVHFYYVFEEPVPFYYANRPILAEMYRVLCGLTQKNILAKTDWHAITQPFRLPGSLTRLGQTVTAWKSNVKWPAKRLAKRLGVDHEEMNLQQRPLLSQRDYQEEKARRESADDGAAKIKRSKYKWISPLEGKVGFYEGCLRRCYQETPEGTRYNSMLALTTVAYKVRLPKEWLERDLMELLDHYNEIGSYMSQKEVQKVLRAYNPKADRTPSRQLEVWFGWEFRRDAQKKREQMIDKGLGERTRAEILEEARAIRDIRMKRQGRKWDDNNGRKPGSYTKEREIRLWRTHHPDGTPKECIEDTGISKNTVYKWWNA